MNKTLKIFSLLFVFANFLACDNEDEVIAPETRASYTFVREASPGLITFINTSQNANSFMWDFGDGSTSTIQNPVKTFAETGEYLVKLTATNTKTGVTSTFSSNISIFVFQGGLVINGNFESGTTPWRFGVDNGIPPNLLVIENGNTYYSINVTAAGNPFDVNLSQVGINMTAGTTYRLTFDAWSDVNRSIIVGIGLSGAPFTNQAVTRNLTPTVQSFSIDLLANFTSTNSRVIFDMGAAIGRVNIDNVTLNVVP